MSLGGALSRRTLVLAPGGRDGAIAAAILGEADCTAVLCDDLPDLLLHIEEGAGLALVVDDVLRSADISRLSAWIDGQPAWSDFPFVILTQRGGSVERNPLAQRLSTALGNVSFLERPFHPTTLVSAVRTALRGRHRQYEARERLEEIRKGEALLERRVAQRTSELESANRQLASEIIEREKVEVALRQAQRLEAIGQLTSGVAHDFNNLLTVISGNVEQLKKRIDDPAIVRRLAMMDEASRRGAQLTAQMLAFSRRQKLVPRAVDLNETVRRMRDLLQSTIGGSVRILEPDLADDLWSAMIDPTQIELVILNLAINARDAMDVGGTLRIGTANVVMPTPDTPEQPPAGEHVVVSVSDTGSGMKEEVLARAFEPFFTTKAVGKGSGLGLSQVFGLAKQSGGGVTIDTVVGEGTTIRIYLPRTETTPVSLPDEPRDLRMAAEQGTVVLVVDDDDAVREVTVNILLDLGYVVEEAGSGGRALELINQRDDIAAVVLDFAMPGMNGNDVAREMRGRRPQLPILFATGYADAEALGDASDDEIVRKPFQSAELAEKLALAFVVGRGGPQG
ncbi:MAG: response regulator [Brevundimonas sp.]|uniref:response regulator n=1 Tax=Brevundimonas sp. TaxID=1871086 RepID=UPI001218213B|nr:response regulator [Brevundimonas sp.]RZJ19028.1 MAG: response regulator [Brevundimonas sp.]